MQPATPTAKASPSATPMDWKSVSLPEQKLLTGIMVLCGMQMLAVSAFSALGMLRHEWLMAVILLLAFLTWLGVQLKADKAAASDIIDAWRAPWPWIITGLLLLQICLYPPMMHDSLSYRIPRMYLALQEGSHLQNFVTTDDRMNAMPWGWECLAMPFASLNALGWSRIINLICWALCYQILYRFARMGGADKAPARWCSLAMVSAPFFLLQAPSTANDLTAGTLLIIGITLMLAFHRSPSGIPALGSLLALVMAANVKPQFLVLGLPWLIWWMAAPGKPWRHTPIKYLLLAAPLFFFVSPLPTLIGNHLTHGSISGLGEDSRNVAHAPAIQMMVAGSIQYLTPQLTLPLTPWADTLTAAIRSIPGINSLGNGIPKFSPGVGLMQILDNGNLGLIHFFLLCFGLAQAFKRKRRLTLLWTGAILAGFLIASSQVVVSTMARSFTPFVLVLLPLACAAAARWFSASSKRIWLLPLVSLCGLASLILNPSAPLWPAQSIHQLAQTQTRPKLAKQLDQYLSYQKRAAVGAGILEPVPQGSGVGILIRQVTPVHQLWQPQWQSHPIQYLHETAPSSFLSGDLEWLLIADKFQEFYPGEFDAYRSLPGLELVHTGTYLPNLKQGPETWRLYRRSEPDDSH